ncbi:uncharacterized protein LOC115894611 [Rhinopithecus roxellana]|uniref:uncharacterized protein LOC115894611 n=1 Tax=Rhinopithecus roxellana TaxID=61622 RepID=UPI0012370AFA|nr:uncharacterized protein LOC115894611 [Rhinopithecus roxellana]
MRVVSNPLEQTERGGLHPAPRSSCGRPGLAALPTLPPQTTLLQACSHTRVCTPERRMSFYTCTHAYTHAHVHSLQTCRLLHTSTHAHVPTPNTHRLLHTCTCMCTPQIRAPRRKHVCTHHTHVSSHTCTHHKHAGSRTCEHIHAHTCAHMCHKQVHTVLVSRTASCLLPEGACEEPLAGHGKMGLVAHASQG